MQVIKLGLISVVVFALLITFISLFFPSHIRISKAIDINSPRDSILSQLSDVSRWKNWYPGADTMEYFFENGKITGLQMNRSGALTRVSSVTDSSVITETSGLGLKKSTSGWNIFSSNLPNTYTIQWYMDIHLGWYPWDKFSGLLLEKRYGPTMERGLDKLKTALENNPHATIRTMSLSASL